MRLRGRNARCDSGQNSLITIKKIKTLKRSTAVRKIARLLQGFESGPADYSSVDGEYVLALFEILLGESDFNPRTMRVLEDQRLLLRRLLESPVAEDALQRFVRICNIARHAIFQSIGIGAADWDLNERVQPASSNSDSPFLGTFQVFLEDLRSPYNIGSIFRTAESFSVSRIVLTESCPSPDHPRSRRAAMGCIDFVPWERGSLDDICDSSHGAPTSIFALELGGTDISEFSFPKKGTVILGNEELGLSPEAVTLANRRGLGLVTIPTFGRKGSLNVASAFAILLYTWRMSLNSERYSPSPQDASVFSGS